MEVDNVTWRYALHPAAIVGWADSRYLEWPCELPTIWPGSYNYIRVTPWCSDSPVVTGQELASFTLHDESA